MKARGNNWTFSSVYTPQSNGLAERMNRTLLNKTRAMLKCAGLSKSYWGEALLHATYIYNRTIANSLKETIEEVMHLIHVLRQDTRIMHAFDST